MEREEKRVVTIRNIDEDLYNKAMSLARSLGKTAGEIVNDALRLLVSSLEMGAAATETLGRRIGEKVEEARQRLTATRLVVGDLDELVVTNRDLVEVEGPVVFRNIGRLVFAEDVDPRVFEDKVAGIIYCDTLVIPGNMPKLKVLGKARFVKRVEIHMGSEGHEE